MICPSCQGTEWREARQCPRFNGKPVCASCCTACEYYKIVDSLACGWYVKHPKINYGQEICKLKQKIKNLEEKADYLYGQNKPWAAKPYEEDAYLAKVKIRELRMKEEADEENKNQAV